MNDLGSHPKDHNFFSLMSVATLIIVLTGFANVYGPRVFGSAEPAHFIVHVHAAIFSCWLFVFVAQCLLVLKGKIRQHQKLGAISMLLAGAMLVSGVVTAVAAANMNQLGIPGVEFTSPLGFLLLNINAILLFIILVSLGVSYRNDPQAHKRFMLMATVAGLAPPGISRLPLLSGHTPAIAIATLAFISLGPIYDWRTRGRIHWAYFVSLPLVIGILPPVVAALSSTDTWQKLAKLMIGNF